MTKKLIPLIAVLLIIGAVTGCTKKADPEMEALKAQMEAMQAELDKAKSGNASAEEIAKLETAIAEIAEQEQQAEQRTTAPDTTPSTTEPATPTATTPAATTTTTTPTTATPAASTSTTTAPASTSTATSARSLGTITNGHLTINNGVTSTSLDIGGGWEAANPFMNNQTITSVTIPNSVRTIDALSFRNCTNLTSVTFGSGVEGIMDLAFANCNLGPSLTIPNGVIFIGGGQGGAFENNQLTSVTLPNSIVDLGGFNNNRLTSVTIPNSVTRILDGAFRNNQLTSIIIPNSVTRIGNWAFQNNRLTHVTIPASVTVVGYGNFIGNPLRSVTFERSGVQIASVVQTGRVYGYAFDDGLSLLDAYTLGGAGTYIYDSTNASSMQDNVGTVYREGGYWRKQVTSTRVVSSDSITTNTNLHAEPSANARVIRPINAGQTVTVLMNTVGASSSPIIQIDNTGIKWTQVEYGDSSGWVRSDHLSGK